MALSFPSNPSTNQTYSYNGKIWVFNGSRWVTSGPAPAVTIPLAPVSVSNTTPSTTIAGAIWVNNSTNAISVYDGVTWITTSSGSSGNISANSLSGNSIIDSSITTDKIANGAITADKIASSTSYTPIASGNTAQRPETPSLGGIRYNSNTGSGEMYTSSGWASFGAVPPTVTSVSPTSFGGEQYTLFTITGQSFTSDAAVKFVTAAGIEYEATIVSYVSSTELNATTSRDFTIQDGPLSVKVSQIGGTTTKLSAIDCGVTPAWSTPSGTLTSVLYPIDTTINTSVLAADNDSGGTVESYSITTGSLPSGLTLESTTGIISGNVTDPGSSSVTTTFSITAYDNAGNPSSARPFSIIRKWADGSSQAQAATSASMIYNLSSSFRGVAANGKYWIKLAGQSTATQIYCNMDSRADNGGWMLIYRKPDTAPDSMTYQQLWYMNTSWNNSTYTNDSNLYPVVPTGLSFKTLGFTKQMFNNTHASWLSGPGDYLWYPLLETSTWTSASLANVNYYKISDTTSGTTSLYSRNSVWGNAVSITDTWAWWTVGNNSGLCGGPNVCGTQACPSASPAESCHTNSSVPLYIYVK